MYKVQRRINFEDGMIIQDKTKCDLPQEVVTWVNRAIGNFAPINSKTVSRILDMQPGDKIKFKVCHISVSIKCS